MSGGLRRNCVVCPLCLNMFKPLQVFLHLFSTCFCPAGCCTNQPASTLPLASTLL